MSEPNRITIENVRRLHAIVWCRFMDHQPNAIIGALEGFKWLENGDEESAFDDESLERELLAYIDSDVELFSKAARQISGRYTS